MLLRGKYAAFRNFYLSVFNFFISTNRIASLAFGIDKNKPIRRSVFQKHFDQHCRELNFLVNLYFDLIFVMICVL